MHGVDNFSLRAFLFLNASKDFINMETRSFFGPEGLTMTSASYVKNLAKEKAREAQTYLNSVQFYSEYLKIISEDNSALVKKGMSPDDIPAISAKIAVVAECNALIAYLGEAIKEQEALIKQAKAWEDVEMREALKAAKNVDNSRAPICPPYPTEYDIMCTWSIGEQEKYLSLQAKCAVLGKLIHEDRPIGAARQSLIDKINSPISVDKNGRDTLITEYVPTVDLDEVNAMYFALQNEHRSAQAEFNGMEKRIKDRILLETLRIDEEYKKAFADWCETSAEVKRIEERLRIREKEVREQKIQEILQLKVVIPHNLRGIYELLTEKK